ncbi:MAG: putative AlkP superfamily pyrophosphatase or phosphodiesterase [Pseudohongiellaceae bacterium]|jgi:predicted AlkP superfamily pyrophosphatase or phosphodiesterase
MSAKLLVIDVVGLVPELVGPRLQALADKGWARTVKPVFPAVTCTAQSSMLTGKLPSEHGIVGNGWYEHDLSEVLFWRQSNRLVQGPKVWETARKERPDLKVAKLFWWYNMYSSADVAVTPRPEYPADGRKIPGVYTWPHDLRARLESRLGPFPLFKFWGPAADITSSRWIADAALDVLETDQPDLALVYLPHLDYVMQRQGPNGPDVAAHALEVDHEAGRLIDGAAAAGMDVLVVSEYGIGATQQVIFPNRALRQAGLLTVLWQDSVGETLDAGASRAFAVCDHQVAHVYVADPNDRRAARRALQGLDGVARVVEGEQRSQLGLDHSRAGDLVVLATPDAWFAYPYWFDDERAPDFARTVDIHRKPGYDPAELFLDPALRFPKLRIARRLAAKKLGFRALLDVIPLDPSLVAGSHGHVPAERSLWPQLIGSRGVPEPGDHDDLRVVHDLILTTLLDGAVPQGGEQSS